MRSPGHTWETPRKPERGNMQRATVSLSSITGMATVDLRWAERYQAAWVIRERETLGSPLTAAWRALQREPALSTLLAYESAVDRIAPPVDTQEYSPDTARAIKRDARDAVIESRREVTGHTDRLPPRENVGTSENETWDAVTNTWHRADHGKFRLAAQTALTDTLGQSSVEAMHGITARVSRNDAYAIVEHCLSLAKTGDVTSLTNTLRVSRDVLVAYGFLAEHDTWKQRVGMWRTICETLTHTQRRVLTRGLSA